MRYDEGEREREEGLGGDGEEIYSDWRVEYFLSFPPLSNNVRWQT